jgi:membrane fusion protein (multidrug efflux system)
MTERQRHSRSRWLGSALAAVLAAGCGRGEPPAPPPPEVVVEPARLGAVPDRREYVGNVRGLNEVDVRARARGYLIERRFTEGQRVAAGEVLFRIDPAPYEVALAEARGRLSQVQAAYELAETEFRRARELRERNVLSQSDFDTRREQREAAEAGLESARAAVAAAELNLSWCTVTAPLAGRIGRALVDVGNLVGEGQDTVLARIVQVDPVHVYFAPTERERLEVLRGAQEGRIPVEREGTIPIELLLGDGSAYPQRGIIDFVDPEVEPTRGTVTVRAVVPNPDGALQPGEFVRVIVVFPDVRDAVLVPERAVLDEQGGSYVLVVNAESVVEYRRVSAGVSRDGMRQIVQGLAVGERVIVDGVQKARPGTKVVAKEAEEHAGAG